MAKRHGLRLSLPGAPNTAHYVPGYPGFFYPDAPTPVGGDGELDMDIAKEADKSRGVPLELIEIKPGEIEAAKDLQAETREAARKSEVIANREGFQGAEESRAQDHRDASKEG